jgi:hypothetical protein
MRREVCLGLVVLATMLVPACDSDFEVWTMFEDNNNDGIPDDSDGDGEVDGPGDVSLWCELTGGGSPGSVPWGYSMRIEVLRAGQTEAEQLTTEDAATDDFNRAPYDTDRGTHTTQNFPITITHPEGECSNNSLLVCNTNGPAQPNVCGGGLCIPVGHCVADAGTACTPPDAANVCGALGGCVQNIVERRFVWSQLDRRLLTGASRDVLASTYNFISNACEGDSICEAEVETDLGGALTPELGVCPGQDNAGDPAMDPGNPLGSSTDTATTFGFDIDSGDTVILEARRSNTPPEGGIVFIQPPGLRFRVMVNGALLQPDEVSGSLTSQSGAASPNLTFSFTVQ